MVTMKLISYENKMICERSSEHSAHSYQNCTFMSVTLRSSPFDY